MAARYPGKCSETGAPLAKGQDIYFDIANRQAYSIEGQRQYEARQRSDDFDEMQYLSQYPGNQ